MYLKRWSHAFASCGGRLCDHLDIYINIWVSYIELFHWQKNMVLLSWDIYRNYLSELLPMIVYCEHTCIDTM